MSIPQCLSWPHLFPPRLLGPVGWRWSPGGGGWGVGWEQGKECQKEEAQEALWVGKRGGPARPVGYSFPAQTEEATSVLFSSSHSSQMLSAVGRDSQGWRRHNLSGPLSRSPATHRLPYSTVLLLSSPSTAHICPHMGPPSSPPLSLFLTGILSALLCFPLLCPFDSSFTVLSAQAVKL